MFHSAPADRQNQWKYSFPGEETKITLAAAAGATALVIGLSQVFNPIALGIGLAYGASKTTYSFVTARISVLRERYMNKLAAKGKITPVPESEEIAKLAADISNKLGRPVPAKVYLADPQFVAKIALPFGLRWIMKIPDIQKMVMARTFAAIPGANTIFTTKEALKDTYTPRELAFITAHEISHLQQEALSPGIFARSFIKHASGALFWGSVAALGLGIAGVSFPVSAVLGGSALTAIGVLALTKTGAEIINNFGLRTLERRADRNALYITHDLDSAVSVMEVLSDTRMSKAKETPFWKEAFLSHPSQLKRVGELRSAFAKVSQCPKFEAVNDNATRNIKKAAQNM